MKLYKLSHFKNESSCLNVQRTKKNEIYLSSVEENSVINCCQVENSTDTEVLWGRDRSAVRNLSDFQFLIHRKSSLKKQ